MFKFHIKVYLYNIYCRNVRRRFREWLRTVRRTILEQFISFHIIHCLFVACTYMSCNSWTASPIAYIYIIHFAEAVQQLYEGTTQASIKTMVSGKLKMVKFRKLGSQADTRRYSRASEKKRPVQDDEESSDSIYIEVDTNSETFQNSCKGTQTCKQKITKQKITKQINTLREIKTLRTTLHHVRTTTIG